MSESSYEIVCDRESGVEGGCTLFLRGRLGTSAAGALREAALELGAAGANVALECAALEFIGGAALQVLIALQRELHDRGASLAPIAPNDEVKRTLALGGIAPDADPR